MGISLMIEKTSFSSMATSKRLLCYYYYMNSLANKKAENFEDCWSILERQIEEKQSNIICFNKYVSKNKENESLSNKDIQSIYKVVNKDRKMEEEEIDALNIAWDKVKGFIEKEVQWEKKTYAYLKNLADKFPPVSRAIIGVLLGILMGLLGDCIYDGIKGADKAEIVDESMVIENSNVIIIDEKDNNFKLLYFTEEGDVKMECLPKDKLDIQSK